VDERIIARRYFISGTVQGVGFRFFAQRTATRLGITGYTRNRFDGRVEVFAMGTREAMEAFRAELERGPGAASVDGVAEEEASVQGAYAGDFSVEYDA
jgi:acylphosphatase